MIYLLVILTYSLYSPNENRSNYDLTILVMASMKIAFYEKEILMGMGGGISYIFIEIIRKK